MKVRFNNIVIIDFQRMVVMECELKNETLYLIFGLTVPMNLGDQRTLLIVVYMDSLKNSFFAKTTKN